MTILDKLLSDLKESFIAVQFNNSYRKRKTIKKNIKIKINGLIRDLYANKDMHTKHEPPIRLALQHYDELRDHLEIDLGDLYFNDKVYFIKALTNILSTTTSSEKLKKEAYDKYWEKINKFEDYVLDIDPNRIKRSFEQKNPKFKSKHFSSNDKNYNIDRSSYWREWY